ncbi:serine/threonine-protein kinase nekl-3-like isoform X2 [Temnothorax nylanderi]|uniref:serine/threonine-protein kinase nekl-3-like isoform X2 n=1 Tax=Temnothorax nylanderi TaxID=102681 RepID=UPI003A8A0FD5
MAIIDGEGNNSSGTNSFEKKVGVNKNVKRIIHIGWKHKIDERSKFIHIKEPIAGAKTIELDQAKKYRLAEVKNMILEAMKTEENSKYFEGSVVDIENRAAASSKIHILTNDFEFKENLPNNRQTVHNVDLSIPVIDEKNIHFSEILLGKGAFGTVKRATWLETDVAVKTMELSTSNKYIICEMNIMDKVRHPNIISIMAVSFSQSQCHIVMEYFDSESLRSVLFNGNSKLKLKLNEKNKSLISYQICKAITFLHESRPAILHKDIKPDNILVDRHYTTKVCDLGLSKCDAMPSALHTTIGHNFQGTPLYMAPEILIQYKEATIYSDVWSLACVIVELYSQKNVWTLPLGVGYNLINLRGIVSTLKAPNLSKMPIYLRSLLKECFLHEPEKRPSAHTLLNTFKGTESLE